MIRIDRATAVSVLAQEFHAIREFEEDCNCRQLAEAAVKAMEDEVANICACAEVAIRISAPGRPTECGWCGKPLPQPPNV